MESLVSFLILLILVAAAIAIALWAVNKFQPPQPVLIVIYAAIAIAALIFLLYVIQHFGLVNI